MNNLGSGQKRVSFLSNRHDRSKIHYWGALAPFLLFCSDFISLIASFVVGGLGGYVVNEYIIDVPYAVLGEGDDMVQRTILFGVLSLSVLGWIASTVGYGQVPDDWKRFGVMLKAIFFAFIVDVVFQYVTKQSFSRIWLIGSWCSAAVLMPLFYLFTVRTLRQLGAWKRSVVVIQSCRVDRDISGLLTNEWPNQYEILSEEVFDFSHAKASLEDKLRTHSYRNVLYVFSAQLSEINEVEHLCHCLEKRGLDFTIIPELGNSARRGLYQDMVFKQGIPFIQGSNRLLKQSNQKLKRVSDIILTLLLLIFLSVPMALLVLFIKRDGGAAIFKHVRVGHGGKEFNCLKFRSMCLDSDKMLERLLAEDVQVREEWGRDFKLKNDPRVTRLGKFIRRTSLDELPQLFNVLRGEMSLVGPRPVVREELDKYYGEDAYIYTAVVPGVTGLWQVSGRNDTSYEKRIDLDARYARSWSFWGDMKILIRTPWVILTRHGAY